MTPPRSEFTTHADALALLRRESQPVTGSETVSLAEAAGRILAQPLTAPHPVPPADNAAVDGYAVRHADLGPEGASLPVSARAAAGHPAPPLTPGTACRIFTGAPMPSGADTVVMQEDATINGDTVTLPAGIRKGDNRRRAGEDLQPGNPVMDSGQILRPQDLAAAASIGAHELTCHEKLSLALFSTGDELIPPGGTLGGGAIHDTNTPLLAALLRGLPVSVTGGGILPDTRAATRDALHRAAQTHHAVITSGGVSRGDEDHVIAVMEENTPPFFRQLAVKPGRPMSVGRLSNSLVFGLPGNPVAAMICFLVYARPAILQLAGGPWTTPVRFPVRAAFRMNKKPHRREFQRAALSADDGRGPQAHRFEDQGSGIIRSLRHADGLVELPEECTAVETGQMVDFIPFSQFGV